VAREFNFDGIAGPTHNYAGLSRGNLASLKHGGQLSNPRAAALEGLEKMRFIAELGVGQAVLPPHPRPDVRALRRLGFSGSDPAVLEAAWRLEPRLLVACSSASAMWAANAATVAPSSDTRDGRLHLTPANLSSLFHRSLEAEQTTRTLRAIFSDAERFTVHDPLPAGAYFSDEGAANHSRLVTSLGAVHVFGWGRQGFSGTPVEPRRYPARQTQEASRAVAKLNQLTEERVLLWQQAPEGIDAGAFHSDVLCVGNDNTFLCHKSAFVDTQSLLQTLQARLGEGLECVVAGEEDFPVHEAVASYAFNSQLITLPSGEMCIIAPVESERNAVARRFLERVVTDWESVVAVHYIDLNSSMKNGGGPACLRLKIPLTSTERDAISARVFFDGALEHALKGWVARHYRDRLGLDDLRDPELLNQVHTALDELSALLGLGSIYPFQGG
jgi:succinylarginine dihydrolase